MNGVAPIVSILRELGVSQSEFARAYKIPRQTVNAWCNGRAMASGWRSYLGEKLEQAYPKAGYADRL